MPPSVDPFAARLAQLTSAACAASAAPPAAVTPQSPLHAFLVADVVGSLPPELADRLRDTADVPDLHDALAAGAVYRWLAGRADAQAALLRGLAVSPRAGLDAALDVLHGARRPPSPAPGRGLLPRAALAAACGLATCVLVAYTAGVRLVRIPALAWELPAALLDCTLAAMCGACLFAWVRFRRNRRRRGASGLGVALLVLCLATPARAGVGEDLVLLRDRCLAFAVGRAPLDANVVTIRHGLWAQSPFSPTGEIDLAASGFALAALPCAVTNGLLGWAEGYALATNASRAVRLLVARSAAAADPVSIERYGYRGMLYHYYTWDTFAGEFRRTIPPAGTNEVSSVDTTLLGFGLLVAAQFFGGPVQADYEAVRDGIDWQAWLDTTTVGHTNQFRMAYLPEEAGFVGWWDWYTQEAMLVCLFAAVCDPSLDAVTLWNAWRRERAVYTSPGPDPQRFACYRTWEGDPFTLYYGLVFLPLEAFPPSDGPTRVDWFTEGRTAYRAHVEFFRKERGYLHDMVYSFFAPTGGGAIALPRGNPAAAKPQSVAPVHAIAGGLPYFDGPVASNRLAQTLSLLVGKGTDFFRWHGWPPATVVATSATHAVHSDWIVGQDICVTALAIENYLAGTVPRLALRDPRLRAVLAQVWRPRAVESLAAGDAWSVRWRVLPETSYQPRQGVAPGVAATAVGGPRQSDAAGALVVDFAPPADRGFVQLDPAEP